jgi:hypothetical protein
MEQSQNGRAEFTPSSPTPGPVLLSDVFLFAPTVAMTSLMLVAGPSLAKCQGKRPRPPAPCCFAFGRVTSWSRAAAVVRHVGNCFPVAVQHWSHHQGGAKGSPGGLMWPGRQRVSEPRADSSYCEWDERKCLCPRGHGPQKSLFHSVRARQGWPYSPGLLGPCPSVLSASVSLCTARMSPPPSGSP